MSASFLGDRINVCSIKASDQRSSGGSQRCCSSVVLLQELAGVRVLFYGRGWVQASAKSSWAQASGEMMRAPSRQDPNMHAADSSRSRQDRGYVSPGCGLDRAGSVTIRSHVTVWTTALACKQSQRDSGWLWRFFYQRFRHENPSSR
jgi:hypothetical protein